MKECNNQLTLGSIRDKINQICKNYNEDDLYSIPIFINSQCRDDDIEQSGVDYDMYVTDINIDNGIVTIDIDYDLVY